ncbi:hypothetical protein PHET_12175 [Paragonimus heterotremus]|uniref:Uncharacterized protein n=1 Tax=Paragonimus heterotremus TaxID=100268 RepID=A0A8J4SKM9_9TREM|nr:hypothetical protein PHET_12175 [Paragonimus heterotremus]
MRSKLENLNAIKTAKKTPSSKLGKKSKTHTKVSYFLKFPFFHPLKLIIETCYHR